MKHFVACDSCKRQYDATGRPVGARFRCTCGGVIEVTAPKVHDAAVVRCSACGAPRQGQSDTCAYCGSTFTLHERDLNTICPACFVRVSDRARYCHHCASPIHPESDAGEETGSACPACGEAAKLVSRKLGGADLPILECGRCAGLWVGAEVFRRLERSARERRLPESIVVLGETPAGKPTMAQAGALYRPCVVCGKLMLRQNYGRRSGVIIDVCKSHGVWFDDRELAQILSWISDGGHERSMRRQEELLKEEERRRRFDTALTDPTDWRSTEPEVNLGSGVGPGRLPGGRSSGSGGLLGDVVADVLIDLFS